MATIPRETLKMKRNLLLGVLLAVAAGCTSGDPIGPSANNSSSPRKSSAAPTHSSRDNYRRIGELEAERARQQSVIRLSEQFIRDNNAENEDSMSRGIYILMDNSHNYAAKAKAQSRIAEIDVELARLRK